MLLCQVICSQNSMKAFNKPDPTWLNSDCAHVTLGLRLCPVAA
ncbi:hypothetical protein Nmel_012309, partial [Mimus melanotis]